MIWWPLIDRMLSEEEVREALAPILGVQMEEIVFAGEDDDLSELPESTVAVIRRSELKGEFVLALEISVWKRELWGMDEANSMRFFCRRLNCACLVGDDTIYADRWVLIEPTGKTRVVILDGDALDDRDEYIIDQDADDVWPSWGLWESRFRNPSD